MQRIEHNEGQVTQHGDIHVHAAVRVPPADHPNSRDCPQCSGSTWRMTQWCMHCGADLFALDAEARRRRTLMKRMKIAGTFMAISALSFYGQMHVSGITRLWVMGLGIFSMIIAVTMMKE